MLELAGGCVCCKVDIKNDLWDGIGDIVARSQPDHVVLETTGIAEPAAILDGLVQACRTRCAIGSCRPAWSAWSMPRPAARRSHGATRRASRRRPPIACCSRSSTSRRRTRSARCHALLDALAPPAERASFPARRCRRARDDRVGARAARAARVDRAPARARSRDARIATATSSSRSRSSMTRRCSASACSRCSKRSASGSCARRASSTSPATTRRGFVERAGVRTSLDDARAVGRRAARTELVLIGDGLDEATVQRALWACRAAG